MKKLICTLLSLALFLTLGGCGTKKEEMPSEDSFAKREEADTEVQKEFDEFLLELYRETVGTDALTLHYSLKDPTAYGIELKEISLGSLSLEESREEEEKILADLEKLNSFDRDELNVSQQDDYDVVKAHLELESNFIGLDYYGHLFSPASSLTSNLITNFVEYRFFDEEDIEIYLTLLEDTARYLDEALDYTAKQVEMGLFMSDTAVAGTLEEIDKFTAKKEDNELIVSFENKLDQYNGLDEAKKDELIERNQAAVQDIVIPAYQKVRDTLEGWLGAAVTDGGYASLNGGKEYYEAYLRYRLGYQGSIDELFEKGEEVLEEIMDEMIGIMYQDRDIFDRYAEANSYFEEADPETIINNFEAMLLSDYPQGPSVSYTAEYLDPSIANDSTIAYYLIPPLDDITDNVIKINPTQTQGDLETLYTTLAHEGFPGHCFQNTYYYNTDPHPIRSVYDFTGYSEGWAMDTEHYALKWLLAEDENLALFLSGDIYYGYLIQSMIDIGVNYYNWSRSELLEWLETYGVLYGLNSQEISDSLYDAVVADPCLLVPYGIGMMEMALLEEKAKNALGNQFDIVEYHRLLLETGPMTFDLLEQKVDQWAAK